MAINSINAPVAKPKKDTLDKILAGLQVAETAFKIPVEYEQFRNYSAEADQKRDEQQGIVTKAKLAGAGIIPVKIPASEAPVLRPPGDTAGLAPPPEAGPALAPPTAAPVAPAPVEPAYYGPKPSTFQVRNGDKVEEMQGVSPEAVKTFFEGEKALRDQYEHHSLTQNTGEVMANGQAALDVLNSNKPKLGSSDTAAIYKFYNSLNPGKMVREGAVDAGKGMMGGLQSLQNMFSGDAFKKGTSFTPESRKGLSDTIKQLMTSQIQAQSNVDSAYTGLATDQGFKPEKVVTGFWASGAKPESIPKDVWDKTTPAQRADFHIKQLNGGR